MSDMIWQPLPDGDHDTQHKNNSVSVKGEWLRISEMVLPYREVVEAEAALPDNVRLCRLVKARPALSVPDDVREAIKDALVQRKHDLAELTLPHSQERYDELTARYDAALVWLSAQRGEGGAMKRLLWWIGYWTIGFIHIWILIGFLAAVILTRIPLVQKEKGCRRWSLTPDKSV